MDKPTSQGGREPGVTKRGMALEAERARRYQAHMSVLLIDLDGLSFVNDSLGRDAGDALLAAVADLIRSSLRKIDVLGRWSPESFLVLTVDVNQYGAIALAEKLRKAISSATFHVAGHQVRITSSVGVTRGIPRDESEVDALIETARRALLKAKAEGRDRVEFLDGTEPHLPARKPPP